MRKQEQLGRKRKVEGKESRRKGKKKKKEENRKGRGGQVDKKEIQDNNLSCLIFFPITKQKQLKQRKTKR